MKPDTEMSNLISSKNEHKEGKLMPRPRHALHGRVTTTLYLAIYSYRHEVEFWFKENHNNNRCKILVQYYKKPGVAQVALALAYVPSFEPMKLLSALTLLSVQTFPHNKVECPKSGPSRRC